MGKYYLFKINENIDQETFLSYLKSINYEFTSIVFLNNYSGYVTSSKLFDPEIENIFTALSIDLGLKITVLCAHDNSELTRYLLEQESILFPCHIKSEADIVEHLALIGNYDFLPLLSNIFSNVNEQLINTMVTLIRSGLNINAASTQLYIHRNTLYFRLNRFIDLTNLDIRDYDNAELLMQYLRLNTFIESKR